MPSVAVRQTVLAAPRTGIAYLTLAGGVQTDATRRAATQGDGLSVPGGIGVWPAATNLNDNGNAASNITGITDTSSTTTRATSGVVKFGSTCFNVVSGNAAANEGPYQAVNGALTNTQYTVSAWVWLVSGAATVRAVLYDTVAGKQGGTAVALTAIPQRISVTATSGIASINIRSYIETTVQQVGTWRIGGWQVETGALATPYVHTDGADATRTAGSALLSSRGILNTTQGAVVSRLTLPYPSSSTPTAPRIFDWNSTDLIRGAIGTDALQIVNDAAGGAAAQTISQTVTWVAGDSILAAQGWDATTLYVSGKGAAWTTNSRTEIPVLASTVNVDVGGGFNAARSINGVLLWQLYCKGVPTSADLAAMNAWGNPVPTIGQITTLSAQARPTALVICDDNGTTVRLLPGYFS